MALKLRLDILRPEHGEALGNLRIQAYKSNYGEQVNEDKLRWNLNDLVYMNFGLFDEGQNLIASLRASVVETPEDFKKVLLVDPPPYTKYPAVVIGRVATAPAYESRGLNSVLRLATLELAQMAGPWTVLGAMEVGSKRLVQLERIGYKLTTVENTWDGFLKNSKPIVLVELFPEKIPAAMDALREKIAQNEISFESVYDKNLACLRFKLHAHRISHERLDFGVNNQALLEEVAPLLEKFPRYDRSPKYGGWSLQAHARSENPIHAGWPIEFTPYNGPENIGPSWTPSTEEERAMHDVQGYVVPTELCTPSFTTLFRRLEGLGLTPRRARIARLGPHYEGSWHQDGSATLYQVRLHIPLKTNDQCFFENEFGRFQMKADGGIYFVHINRPHRVVNESHEDRLHFVVHVWDRNAITKHHRYDARLFDRETHHKSEVDVMGQYNKPPQGRV